MLLMNDITKITIVFAAILAILMVVLIIVTIKVLKGGKDEEEEENVEEKVEKAMSDDEEGQDDYSDEEYYEDDEPEESAAHENSAVSEDKTDAVEEEQPVINTAVKGETQKIDTKAVVDSADYGDENDDDVYDDEEYNEPTDDISEIQKEVRKAEQKYVSEDTLVMDEVVDGVRSAQESLIDSEFADSAFAPQSVADKLAETVAKVDEEKKAEYEARKAAKKVPDVILPKPEVDDTAASVNAAPAVSAHDESAKDTDVSGSAEKTSDSEYDDSAFADSAFGDSAFSDSAFADSAFGKQPEPVEEHIRPLPETSPTIPVNPVNAVNIATVNSVDQVNTTNETAGISDMNEVKDFLEENPVPKKKRRKVKKKEQEFIRKFGDLEPHFRNGNFYWYNNQDIENLTKKEDMYFYCHYFNNVDDAVMPLIVEMYDCAFVRTEEIQYIAYGVRFKSMNFRQIINTREHIDFDMATATKQPSQDDIMLIYEKWRGYVDKFMEIIVFNAPDNVREEIIDKMYEYGRNDVDVLMNSPE